MATIYLLLNNSEKNHEIFKSKILQSANNHFFIEKAMDVYTFML